METLVEEKLAHNLMFVEAEDTQAVDDRVQFLREMGWHESSRVYDAGRVRAMLEKAA